MNKKLRQFKTGATRNNADNKLDYEGFINPIVEWAFAQYMHKHRLLEDGTMRASDNWQLGIPQQELMKSAHRHWQDLRLIQRDYTVGENGKVVSKLDALLGLKFNVDAMIFDELKNNKVVDRNYTRIDTE